MAFAILSLLILLSILCVNGDIYLYNNSSYICLGVFKDVLSTYGPGLPLTGTFGYLRRGEPIDGCSEMKQADRNMLFVIVQRHGCTYEAKVRHAQAANFSAVIVHNVDSNELIAMSYENSTGIRIPAVFVSEESGELLLAHAEIPGTSVVIDEEFLINSEVLFGFTVFVIALFLFMLSSMCARFLRNRRRHRRRILPVSVLKSIPRQKYDKNLNYDRCVICQENFKQGDFLRILPCSHAFHVKCIDVWLTEYKRVCPVCKRRVLGPGESPVVFDSDSESEETATGGADDRTPLLRGGRVPSGGSTTSGGSAASGGEPVGEMGSWMNKIKAKILGVPAPAPFRDDEEAVAGSSSGAGRPYQVVLVHSVNADPEEYENTASAAGPDMLTRHRERVLEMMQELYRANDTSSLTDTSSNDLESQSTHSVSSSTRPAHSIPSQDLIEFAGAEESASTSGDYATSSCAIS